MYLDHWSLERPPFEAQPDSRFLFVAEQHEPALAAISYAACEGGEPALLSGPSGCGKTLLLRALRRQLPRERYQVGFVPEVACSEVKLLTRVAYYVSRKLPADAASAMDVVLQQVRDAEQRGCSIVLMLDDWPANADAGMLEELRWLLNIDMEGSRLGVLLAGENVRPDQQWPTWLVQRLFTVVRVAPLRPEHVPAYLAHRLQVASGQPTDGRNHRETFTPEAAALIADWSGGIPRLINRLAHLALHVAYLDLASRVEPEVVRRAMNRLVAAGDGQGSSPAGALTPAEPQGAIW